MKLEDLEIYKLAMDLGEAVHEQVITWSYFQKDTIGKQLVRSADSVAANLSEGVGRYHFKEKKNFSYYSRGSLFETKTWIIKARNRKYIKPALCKTLVADIDKLGIKINNYIKKIGK
jgi:four helix bundle protein